MMRSESTSALGQPRLTKPIFGAAPAGLALLAELSVSGLVAAWAQSYREVRAACLLDRVEDAAMRMGACRSLPGGC